MRVSGKPSDGAMPPCPSNEAGITGPPLPDGALSGVGIGRRSCGFPRDTNPHVGGGTEQFLAGGGVNSTGELVSASGLENQDREQESRAQKDDSDEQFHNYLQNLGTACPSESRKRTKVAVV